jgi:hypothetical protein
MQRRYREAATPSNGLRALMVLTSLAACSSRPAETEMAPARADSVALAKAAAAYFGSQVRARIASDSAAGALLRASGPRPRYGVQLRSGAARGTPSSRASSSVSNLG